MDANSADVAHVALERRRPVAENGRVLLCYLDFVRCCSKPSFEPSPMAPKNEKMKMKMTKRHQNPRWALGEIPSVAGFYCLLDFRFVLLYFYVMLCCVALFVARFPIPPLSTDCPEVIGLVNHSATVLVIVKNAYFNLNLYFK